MRKLVFVTLCILGMTGFWFLVKFMVTGVSAQFGHGFFAGIALFVIMFWIGERLDAFRVVEPSKGVWIPNEDLTPVRRDGDL